MGQAFRKEIVRTVRRKVWACCRNARISGRGHSIRKEREPLAVMRYYRRTGRKYQGKDTMAESGQLAYQGVERIHGGAFDVAIRFMR